MIEVQNNNSRPAPIKGNHDRPALRADAEWLENLDPAPADGGEPFSVFETGTIRARPQVQAGLAIGKFVKEPFDEEARRNMFGQAAKELAGRK